MSLEINEELAETLDDYPDHWQMGPSSASRWIRCPGSLRVPPPEDDEEEDNEAAERGTLGHSIVEARLYGRELEAAEQEFLDSFEEDERDRLLRDVETCIKTVGEVLGSMTEPFEIYLETKIPDDTIIEHGGTIDVIIVTATLIYVIDFKFGQISVAIKDNDQIQCYLNLARQTFPGRSRFMGMIIQPAHNEGISEEFPLVQLEDHTVAVLKASISNEFHAGDHCNYCPLVRAGCETLAKYQAAQVEHEFPDLTQLVNEVDDIPSEDQLELLVKIYKTHKLAVKACEGVSSLIKRYHNKGANIKSHGLGVQVSNRMDWADNVSPEVIALAERHGLTRGDVVNPPSVITPAALRDLLGMKTGEFREEFRRIIDIRKIESLVMGRAKQQEFPEFD